MIARRKLELKCKQGHVAGVGELLMDSAWYGWFESGGRWFPKRYLGGTC
jgi:hypothetical protein